MKGRVIQEHKTSWVIATPAGDLSAIVRGKFHVEKEFPKVGDYVEYVETDGGGAAIEEVLPRTSEIARASWARGKRDGRVSAEVLVANVDVMFIVMGLDSDFNPTRAERYVSLAKQSQVRPVLLLSKADTMSDAASYVAQMTERLPHVPVHAISARTGEGMAEVLGYMTPDTTAVLLGSSGAGKSTITNWLLKDDKQTIGGVREDDSRGRHTTTARELFNIPTGGFLIDTPGMRELGLMGETEEVFTDIEALTPLCKFSDCDHEKSTGCAVRAAVERGEVSAEQFSNYLKLRRERAYVNSKTTDASERRSDVDKKKRDKKNTEVAYTKYKRRGGK